MEVPWQNLFSEVEMEEYGDLLNHEHNNSLDDEETVLEDIMKQFALSSESESYSSQLQINSATPSNNITSFYNDSTIVTATTCEESCGGGGCAQGVNQTTSKHIMAERKRRQELSQRFIALSALIPGLPKIDKISILKEAIGYVKHLQNRVRELELEQEHGLSLRKINLETVSSFTDDKGLNVALPEVEARVLENDVLIRIHCDKHEGILLKILSHVASLDFSVVRTCVLPFGNCAIYITIIAQMGDKCNVTVKDLVKSLRRVLLE